MIMSLKDVRRGNTQAQFNKSASNWLFLEIFTIAVIIGWYDQSWYAFGGSLLVMIIMLNVRVLAIALLVILSILWGYIGWYVGSFFNWGTESSVVLAVFGLLSTGGLHMAALEWVEDLNVRED